MAKVREETKAITAYWRTDYNSFSYALSPVLHAIGNAEKKYGDISDIRINIKVVPECGRGDDREAEHAEVRISFDREETAKEKESRLKEEERERQKKEAQEQENNKKEKELLLNLIEKHGVPLETKKKHGKKTRI